jgi:hypothetical protein
VADDVTFVGEFWPCDLDGVWVPWKQACPQCGAEPPQMVLGLSVHAEGHVIPAAELAKEAADGRRD